MAKRPVKKRKPRVWVGWTIATKIEPNRPSMFSDEFFTKHNHAKRSLKLRLIPEDLEVIKVRIVEVV